MRYLALGDSYTVGEQVATEESWPVLLGGQLRQRGLPADTVLWSRLQSVSGGLWGGCVYDPDAIVAALASTPA